MQAPSTSPLWLPLRTLGLVGRNWAPLLFWAVAGYLAHELAIGAAAWLAHRNLWLGFAGLSFSVLIMLTTLIMMFQAVRPKQPAPGPPSAPARPASASASASGPGWPPQEQTGEQPGERRLVDTIAESILPFLVFYGAWGLFAEEVRAWGVKTVNQDSGSGIDAMAVLAQTSNNVLLVPLGIAIGSWIIRAICERFYNLRGGRTLGLVTALFEANWMFFAVVSVSGVIGGWKEWLTDRVFWVETTEAISGALQAIPGVDALANAWSALSPNLPDIQDGLLLPLVWLTITAAVYGEGMDRDDRIIADSRLERAGHAFGRLSPRTQLVMDLMTREVREKWTPLVNGLRLVLRSGLVVYLWFCLLYAAIEVGVRWLFIGIKTLIGPHPYEWWFPILGPLEFGEQMIYDVLRVTLLAATFALIVERAARPRRRPVSDPAGVGAPAPPAPVGAGRPAPPWGPGTPPPPVAPSPPGWAPPRNPPSGPSSSWPGHPPSPDRR